jgi:hypothetical protein
MSGWFDSDSDMSTKGMVATGMLCKDKYCGRVNVQSIGILVDPTTTTKSGWISDNVGKQYLWNDRTDATSAVCPKGTVITHVKCRGKHCDDLQLSCSKPKGWVLGERRWNGADWFSDSSAPSFQSCPAGFGMIGLGCKEGGKYCHSKKILCGELVPLAIGTANTGIASVEMLEKLRQVPCDAACQDAAAQNLYREGVLGVASGMSLSSLVTTFVLICWATLK